ncbi:rod shape-determining protein MreD [Sporolactobacillus vineae]|uniref:rod shape-determining protein MreD n=1 Tax=Sporolactobacillus vineae TaxID=444463 RepID=UPI001EE66FD6|nr:rod shape-determining protein MreD [Sporolactobacillus vineae]
MKLFFILFLLFLIEGTVLPHVLPLQTGDHFEIVPAFVMVAVLLIAFFANVRWGMRYAILFGLLNDIVNTSVIGVYAFSMGLSLYLTYLLSKWVNLNLMTALALSAFGVLLCQIEVYLIYLMIGVTTQPVTAFLIWRLPPTLVLNIIFTLIFYFPFWHFLSGMDEEDVR